uniref:Uncharacterized protein n=1 Tax=Cacopsylla melanoneura TaxID=428564 RepID=A0A8D8RE78_9HEMI
MGDEEPKVDNQGMGRDWKIEEECYGKHIVILCFLFSSRFFLFNFIPICPLSEARFVFSCSHMALFDTKVSRFHPIHFMNIQVGNVISTHVSFVLNEQKCEIPFCFSHFVKPCFQKSLKEVLYEELCQHTKARTKNKDRPIHYQK